MESFFGRYKNPLVLMAALFIQVIVLATQVKRPSDPKIPNSPGTRLIRVWTVTAFTPLERALVGTGHFFRNGWHDYVDLHGVRRQNRELLAEITRLRMEEVSLKQDAEQAHRLQALLGFRERFIAQTAAAQVIGTSGSERSRVIYIDKGVYDGIKADMAVITPDGIVGKVKDVLPLSSQVLLINDRDSGAGVILEKSRLQGVLRGTGAGDLQIDGIMADQNVEPGERVIASGGDRIYPKGMPVGTITGVAPDRDTGTFLTIKLKPAADLNRLEEVLVVTKMAEATPSETASEPPARAADILAEHLPTVPKQPQPPAVAEHTAPDTGAVQKKPASAGTEAVVKKSAAPGTSVAEKNKDEKNPATLDTGVAKKKQPPKPVANAADSGDDQNTTLPDAGLAEKNPVTSTTLTEKNKANPAAPENGTVQKQKPDAKPQKPSKPPSGSVENPPR